MGRKRGSAGAGCLSILVLFGLLGVLFAGGDESAAPPAPQTTPTASKVAQTAAPKAPKPPAGADVVAAKKALDQLSVKGRAPMTDYSREAFGTAWSDTNDNGCDTRNDVLRRDLQDKDIVDCVVMSGVLIDPYSGQRIVFERGPVTSLDVQIDHVVSLGNAWATGAAYWTDDRREQFANDRRNLLAVRGDLNAQKQDGDTATWLPPRKANRCEYVATQVLTKQRYQLWVTPAEKAAMQRVLQGC